MEPGPLPPHERPWRHPSELGPPPHEPTSTSGRVLIATSAAVSLLLIGLFALAVTPDRLPAPIAASSTVGSARTRTSFPAAIASSAAITTARQELPVVTPVGDEGWAVTTRDAVAGRTGWMDARLPSGEVIEIEVVGLDPEADLVVVTLPPHVTTGGYELAARRPGPSDTVYVSASEPMVVTLDDLADLDVEEATPVLDGAGALVGLCTGGRDGTALMTVDTMPGTPPEEHPTTIVATTAPPTSPEEPSTVPESTAPESSNPESPVADSTAVETTVAVTTTAPPTSGPAPSGFVTTSQR